MPYSIGGNIIEDEINDRKNRLNWGSLEKYLRKYSVAPSQTRAIDLSYYWMFRYEIDTLPKDNRLFCWSEMEATSLHIALYYSPKSRSKDEAKKGQ